MNCKTFCLRFNRELSQLGFPEEANERKEAVHRVFNVSRQLANALVFGHPLPRDEDVNALVNKVAIVLEVCPQWLMGTGKRKAYSAKEAIEST
jgi:hypothetical protein